MKFTTPEMFASSIFFQKKNCHTLVEEEEEEDLFVFNVGPAIINTHAMGRPVHTDLGS